MASATKSSSSMRMMVVYAATALGMVTSGKIIAATPPGSNDQPDTNVLKTIVVTAEKRAEPLQKVPLTVVALTGKDLQALGAVSLNDYFKFVPGLNYAPTASGDRGGQNIIIRGVSNTRLTGVDSAASASTTSFYLNDIPVTLIDPELFDVQRVEILKGPQGTLFGAASMGGTVRIIMNKADPSGWAAAVQGTLLTTADGFGNRFNGMVNIPLIHDVLAARLVLYHRADPGYISEIRPQLTDTTSLLVPNVPGMNLLGPQRGINLLKNTNTHTSNGARLSFSYTPNSRFSLEPTVLYQNIKDGATDAFDAQLNDGFVKKRFLPEPQSQSFFLASLEGKYDFGPVELVSATAHFARDYNEDTDETLGTYKIFGGTPSGAIAGSGALATEINTDSFTQELRLQSTGHSSSDLLNHFDWVLGGFYSDERRLGNQLWYVPGFNENAAKPIVTYNDVVFGSVWHAQDTNRSLFANVTAHVTEKFRLAAGLRYYNQGQVVNRNLEGPLQGAAYALTPDVTRVQAHSTGITPRYIASYQVTPRIMTYVSAAKGFRAGGGVVPSTEPNCLSVIQQQHLEAFNGSFGPDSLWQYEGGAKSTWAGGRLQVNGAAYLIRWTQLQQSISLGQFFQSTCTKVLTANVGDAEIKGFDADIHAIPVKDLLVSLAVSLSRARITGVDPAAHVGYVGAQLQNVPDWTGTASIAYSFPDLVEGGSGYVRADYSYRSSVTTVVGAPTNPLLALPSYANVDFRMGINWHGYNVEAFIDNALNSLQLLDAGPGTGTATYQVANRPRTVGVTVGKNF